MPVQQKYIRNDGTCTTDFISMLIVLILLSAHTFRTATASMYNASKHMRQCCEKPLCGTLTVKNSKKILGRFERKTFELCNEFAWNWWISFELGEEFPKFRIENREQVEHNSLSWGIDGCSCFEGSFMELSKDGATQNIAHFQFERTQRA